MTKLETLTNVAILIVSITIAGDVAIRAWNRVTAAPSATSRAAPLEYKVGDFVEAIPDLKRSQDRDSLLLVLRSTCPYCTQSLPFYQRLANEMKSAGTPVQLHAVCTESADVCADYLASGGVATDQVVGVAPGTLKIAGTPTLLLVRANGRVAGVWKGLLNPDSERDVIKAVVGKTAS